MSSLRWSWLAMLVACADEGASGAQNDASDRRDAAVRDAASSVVAPDAALDAALLPSECAHGREADGGCVQACVAIDCSEGYVCRVASCDRPGCVGRAQCMRVVADCTECGVDEACLQPACFGDPRSCPTVCERLPPK